MSDRHSLAGRSGPGTFPAPLKWLCQAGFSPWFLPRHSLMYLQLPGPPLLCWIATVGSCFGFFQMFPLSCSALSLLMFLSQRGTWRQAIASLFPFLRTLASLAVFLAMQYSVSVAISLECEWLLEAWIKERKKMEITEQSFFFFIWEKIERDIWQCCQHRHTGIVHLWFQKWFHLTSKFNSWTEVFPSAL